MSVGRLCACLLNVSEARSKTIVENIAKAALQGARNDTAVLNIFSDKVYNRSVITITSTAESIGESVTSACREAYNAINISNHTGGHPRLGAVDLIPIHPISEHVSLDECGQIAIDIANNLSTDITGTAFFLFGAADLPQRRGLVQKRKLVDWYSGNTKSNCVDVGSASSPNSKYGLTGIGAIPYVMNCNVQISTTDLELGRTIGKSLRATTPNGLPGVQTMALNHDDCIEIACNVEGNYLPDHEQFSSFCSTNNHLNVKSDLICSFGKYYHVSPSVIERRVTEMAELHGVSTNDTVIVGFKPEEVAGLAKQAIKTGQREFWKTRQKVMM